MLCFSLTINHTIYPIDNYSQNLFLLHADISLLESFLQQGYSFIKILVTKYYSFNEIPTSQLSPMTEMTKSPLSGVGGEGDLDNPAGGVRGVIACKQKY